MIKWFADTVTYDLLGLQKGTPLADSLNFFVYDVPKIYILLLSVMFVVAIVRSFFPPEKIRAILGHKKLIVGNILAAVLGVFMPFCTCSAVPMFLGMIESGVPLGVTMSFLIASPMINEMAAVLLWGLFGWKVAALYIASGMVIAVTAGYIIGRLNMEKYINRMSELSLAGEKGIVFSSWKDRFRYAYDYSLDVFRYIWLYVLIGIGIGAFIHGYVPQELLVKLAGKENPFAVVIAVAMGVPIYANCAGAIPVIQALMGKGMQLGTTLAFLMGVTALSLPEYLILSKVIRPRLLLTYFGVVATGIVIVGYFFNWVFK